MSYSDAKKKLTEALDCIDHKKEPFLYELAAGLLFLTGAIEADLQQISNRIHQLEDDSRNSEQQ